MLRIWSLATLENLIQNLNVPIVVPYEHSSAVNPQSPCPFFAHRYTVSLDPTRLAPSPLLHTNPCILPPQHARSSNLKNSSLCQVKRPDNNELNGNTSRLFRRLPKDLRARMLRVSSLPGWGLLSDRARRTVIPRDLE